MFFTVLGSSATHLEYVHEGQTLQGATGGQGGNLAAAGAECDGWDMDTPLIVLARLATARSGLIAVVSATQHLTSICRHLGNSVVAMMQPRHTLSCSVLLACNIIHPDTKSQVSTEFDNECYLIQTTICSLKSFFYSFISKSEPDMSSKGTLISLIVIALRVC